MPSDVDQGTVQTGGTGNTQSIEDRVGNALWGDAEPEAEPAGEDAEVDQGTDETTDEADDQGETQSTAVDEVEVEFETWKGKIPAKLKAEIDKGADYTRKTQELSERGKLFDVQLRAQQEQAAFMQAAQAEIDQFKQIEAQLEQYRKVDLSQIDSETLARMSMAAANLREEKARLQETLNGKRNEFRTKMLGHWDDMSKRAHDAITKAVPGWDKVAGEVAQYALNEGFPFEHITGYDRSTRERVGPGVVDPLFAKALYKAMQYDKLQAGKATVLGKAKNAPPVLKPGATDSRAPQQIAQMNFKKSLKAAGSDSRKAEVIGEKLMRSKLFG
jgi:hypothetical protein